MTLDLYLYTDYRLYLRDWFSQAKEESPAMSYRFLAKRLGIDAGFLVHIIQGQKHLAEKHLAAMVAILKLGKRETEYFQRLVVFCKAKGEREIGRRYLELMELRESDSRKLSASHYRYYLHWYVPAIRCLIAATEFCDDYAGMATKLRPAISEQEAKQSVALLKKLGMIRRTSDGIWETIDTHVTTGDSWTGPAIQAFQKQTLELAIEALENLPKTEREISTMTFSIPKDEIATVQEMVREFRAKMARWAVASPTADSVYQMNIQVFPLARQ